jgi:hypothetical protein
VKRRSDTLPDCPDRSAELEAALAAMDTIPAGSRDALSTAAARVEAIESAPCLAPAPLRCEGCVDLSLTVLLHRDVSPEVREALDFRFRPEGFRR